MAFKNAESDVEEFVQGGATDSEDMEFSDFEHSASRLPAAPVPNTDTRENLLAFAQPADREKLKLHRISEIHLLLDSCPVGIDGCES